MNEIELETTPFPVGTAAPHIRERLRRGAGQRLGVLISSEFRVRGSIDIADVHPNHNKLSKGSPT